MTKKFDVSGISKLRDDLVTVYDGLRRNSITRDAGKSYSEVAGKIIKTAKIQIEYQNLMKTKKKIDFLEK